MSTYMNRDTGAHTHMGGEGANWIGNASFTHTKHVFQNLGDGTYFHSGLLAIRACVAAEVNITYKILYNDAVAMTGGQPVDGPLSPMSISRQVAAEGVKRIVVVSDEPDKYGAGADFAPGASFEHRRELDRVQRELRDIPGVTVLIYDQTCAAEKRRRRKRGAMIDPPRRIFINDAVCEGCGDCSRTSNCLSVLPLETPLGRKRMIDQSSCNKDYSCAEGFCPSFVNVIGAVPRKSGGGRAVPRALSLLPEPSLAKLPDDRPYSLLVTGIGGTGVVTIAALLTMAAHMEGKAFSTIDQFGMAQKGGAVTSHLRIAADEGLLGALRLGVGSADLLLGCDSLVTGGELALAVIDPDRTRVVVNSRQSITGHFALEPGPPVPGSRSLRPHSRGGGPRPPRRAGRDPARHRASGRFDRHQPLHARLRLPEGGDPDWRGGDWARDRTERPGDRDEQAGLPLGPAGGARSGRRRGPARRPGAGARDAGRDRRPPPGRIWSAIRTRPMRPATRRSCAGSRRGRASSSAPPARSASRSPAISTNSWPTRTSTRSPGSIPTPPSARRSRPASTASSGWSCCWPRRSSRGPIR